MISSVLLMYRCSLRNHLEQRETWDFAFTEGSSEHNILTDTLSWFNVVFAYRDHGSGPHTVTLSLFQIPVKRFNFFRFKSNPKTILQKRTQMRKQNLV